MHDFFLNQIAVALKVARCDDVQCDGNNVQCDGNDVQCRCAMPRSTVVAQCDNNDATVTMCNATVLQRSRDVMVSVTWG